MRSPEAMWRWLRVWRRENLLVDRAAVLEHVDEGGALGPRFAFMTLMSAGIAMLGLLQGSGAVIIGAMLISPLMGPIVEMGMALATFDLRTLRDSLRNMGVGVLLALLISILIVAISPLQEPTQEILSRTEPTLFDLLVAIFSGLAGAYATITRKGETIVGVAIATALMPPLAVVGFGIAVGNASIAGGAAFLFMTNLLAIALSVTIMARWYGFGSVDSPKQTLWQLALVIGSFVLLSIPLGLALRSIALRGLTERSIRTALDASAREGGGSITTLRVAYADKTVLVDAVLLTPTFRPRLDTELERKLEDALGRPVVVEIREVLTADDKRQASDQASLATMRDSIARLQTAARQREASEGTRQHQREELQAQAVGFFGELVLLDDGKHAQWRLAASSGIDIAHARQLERQLAKVDGMSTEIVPALQALPLVQFADDASGLDPAAERTLQDIAWALQRWRSEQVNVIGQAGANNSLALARAESVANWLHEHGFIAATAVAADAETARTQVRLQGNAAVRAARVQPVTD
ncbi:MAG: DUF389 domain-containing protein [Pseudoxanthomonas sp.]